LIAGLVAAHAVFWHIDLPVIGGYTLVTWLTEKISNEVNGRTRATNRRIDSRFERLAHDQIQRVCEWMDRQAPSIRELDKLERMVNELAEASA
jgi:predicted membrane-bound dolichyl-phosphate-mannose-protein mannosyltransferase